MTSPTLIDVERKLHLDALRSQPEFAAFRGIPASLPETAYQRPALLGFFLRHALEASWLRRHGVAESVAELAAARVSAQFIEAEAEGLSPADRAALPVWVPVMAAEVAPAAAAIAAHFRAGDAEIALVRSVWSLLGTAEALMETGGDIRLARDPLSALNGYGCSHRPRPWAVTFASSTASSSSERGYVAADRARLRNTRALLKGLDRRIAVRNAIEEVRRGISGALGLEAGTRIVFAASGTDTELLALALAHLAESDRPVLNILIAPEETGRGVPMAARGLHFAVDTALGHDVTFQAPIAGFRDDTRLKNIALRGPTGALRGQADIEADIAAAMAQGIEAGQRVILHGLDLSKTGLLAPRPAFLKEMRAKYGQEFDIVLDACQARLSPASIRRYLALDAVVLITGSKFFTGPPFAGAALLPPGVASRLQQALLPAGLDAYFGRDEFPTDCPAAMHLPPVGNFGLALRWQAALAEIRALLRVTAARRADIVRGFGQAVSTAIGRYESLTLLEAPAIIRFDGAEDWELLPSIFTFSLNAPHEPARCLTPAEARDVYLWLNTDLSALLPQSGALAARICHIGQPVPLPQPGGEGVQGALRVSAGARLISGEPSHRGLRAEARLKREFSDLELVFAKIDLILRHWSLLVEANPAPRYRPAPVGGVKEVAAF
jgi:hypothetical protein